MSRIDKNQILINFLDKVKDAKRLNMNDVRMSIKELDELAYVMSLLMSEKLSKLLDTLEPKEENVKEKNIKKPIVTKTIIENMPMKKVIEEIAIDIQEKIEDNDEYEDNEDSNIMYGGTF